MSPTANKKTALTTGMRLIDDRLAVAGVSTPAGSMLSKGASRGHRTGPSQIVPIAGG